MGGKAEPLPWRLVEDELAIKYFENLDVIKSALFWVMLNAVLAHL